MSIQTLIYTFTASLIALFPVMNPVSSGFIVNSFLEGLDNGRRRVYAKKIMTHVLFIGIGSILIGHLILLIFGLAIPVIQVAGGFIICKTGFDWLSDDNSKSITTKERAIDSIDIAQIENKLFYPISFPISIGPGSISIIFTLMASSVEKDNLLMTGLNYVMIVLVICLLSLVLYLFITQGNRISGRLGKSGNLVINKFIAFITFCIGLQILFNGIAKVFHITVL